MIKGSWKNLWPIRSLMSLYIFTCLYTFYKLKVLYKSKVASKKIDLQSKLFLESINALHLPPFETEPIELLRSVKVPYYYKSHAPIGSIENITIPGPFGTIPLRIYTPTKKNSSFPVFVTYHGGGWCVGSVDYHEGFSKEICYQADCIVISVDYRLSPEYKFPIPLLDCYEATKWATKEISQFGGDPKKIAIGGDSAGGNLAAAIALMARDKNEFSILCQVLLYPITQYNFDTKSYQKYAEGYMVTRSFVEYSWKNYLHDESEGQDPYASPAYALSHANLPPTLMVTTLFDPLRDDSIIYAKKLRKAGVPLTHYFYPTIHGFLNFADRLDIGKKGTKDIAKYLQRIFFKA